MDRMVMRNVLSLAYMPRARACYLDRTGATAASRDLTGRVRLAIDVVRGEVERAAVESSTLNRADVERCLREGAFAIEVPRVGAQRRAGDGDPEPGVPAADARRRSAATTWARSATRSISSSRRRKNATSRPRRRSSRRPSPPGPASRPPTPRRDNRSLRDSVGGDKARAWLERVEDWLCFGPSVGAACHLERATNRSSTLRPAHRSDEPYAATKLRKPRAEDLVRPSRWHDGRDSCSCTYPPGEARAEEPDVHEPPIRASSVAHRPRPEHDARHPVHVTLRARGGLPSFRAPSAFAALTTAIARASGDQFRIIQFSVQVDHVHASLRPPISGRCLGVAGFRIRAAPCVQSNAPPNRAGLEREVPRARAPHAARGTDRDGLCPSELDETHSSAPVASTGVRPAPGLKDGRNRRHRHR